MNPFRRTLFFCASLLFCLAPAPSVFAQTSPQTSTQLSIDPARLPQNTVFYVLWRGAPAPAARTANSLYALWDDPGFAPARAAMFDNFLSESGKSSDAKSQITREELSEYLTLLENPMSVGFVSDPATDKPKSVSLRAPSAADSASPKSDSAHKWNGFFFIYDRTGKEALLAKALLRIRAAQKDPPKLTPTTIAGVPAMKVEHKTETDYWVEIGRYAISSGEPSVVEQILRGTKTGAPSSASLLSPSDVAALDKVLRNTKTTAPSSTFLGGVPAFKEANPVLGGGILEYFINISSVTKLAADSSGPGGFRTGPVLGAMKIDALHSVAGRVVLDGSKTRMQLAFLGEASAGTVFDIWDAGQEKPASLAYVSPAAVSYRETQLNLPGIYALAMRVAKSFTAKGDEDKTDLVESMARAKLGMSISDALTSFTGELGYLQNDSSFDFSKHTYFIGLRNRENSLKVIRRVFIDEISSDLDEGNVTFLNLSFGGKQNAQTASNAIHLAVTSDMILIANQRDALNPALAQHTSSAKPSLLDPFLADRAKYPQNINGLNFMDFQKFDWQSLRDLPFRDTTDKKSAMESTGPEKTAPSKAKSWLDEIDPKVFARHLHFSSGYSWKDASGIHFDGWID
jgi:hypothetical protein